ncbi:MAG: D-glycero-beta-D-manno-heptose 1-phosphate adenylyltransferase [Desulfobacterota bacterium]|nr:D-glycero-beta-D-manno-heptose 1-phosphate adenylyltransferase [Thermodesulfobacteriota bacterium]
MHQPRRLKDKIKSVAELKPLLRSRQRRGEKVVFTNGCFDLVHAGHVQLLEQARASGDLLVVALNSDASVRGLKGTERPIVPQEQRARVIAALESVDYVVIFEESDPLSIITELKPDVLVKGGDWTPDTIIGRDVVEQAGGRVFAIPLMDGVSTSDIIARIKKVVAHQQPG